MLSNYMEGKPVTDIKWKAVAVSTAEGALTAGASAGRKLLVKTTAAVIKSGIDYAQDHDIKDVSDGVNIVKNAAVDMTVDKVAGGTSKVVLGKVGKATLQKVAGKTAISTTKATNVVRTVTKVSNSTARKIVQKAEVKEGGELIGRVIKDAPATIGENAAKAAANKQTTDFKDNTNRQ